MENKQHYVVGFMFDEPMRQVVLIEKQSGPECVIGKWNGIGGKIESWELPHGDCDGETPLDAVCREFHEETGIHTPDEIWQLFTQLRGPDFVVHCFWAADNYCTNKARTKTDEEVKLFNAENLTGLALCPCVGWWIPFLRDRTCVNRLCSIEATYSKDESTTSLQT